MCPNWRSYHTCPHLLRAVAVLQQCLRPTHHRCCWLCPLSGRLMDQRPTGTASWLPTHNQISRTACHRWKSKWVILHKLAILHPSGNKRETRLLVLFFADEPQMASGAYCDCLFSLHVCILVFVI